MRSTVPGPARSLARSPVEQYLDEVMRHARLAPADARRVRSELHDHLLELLESRNVMRRAPAPGPAKDTPREELSIMHKEFGDPAALGDAIGKSKGRLRTWLKKKARRLAVAAAVVAAMIFVCRATVAEAFVVVGDSVAPAIPAGNRCLVFKLASHYAPQDLVVYKPAEQPERRYLAVVTGVDERTGELHLTRNHVPPFTVPRSAVIGRVVLNTR